MKQTLYTISGMTCGGCVNRVKNTLSAMSSHVEVTLNPPQAILTEPTASMADMNAALSQVGHYVLSTQTPIAPIANTLPTEETRSWLATYRPLLLVFGYILLVTLAIEAQHGTFELHRFMPHFMAGFFLVFSFFKLLDIRGFASSYAMYDVLAKKWATYGLIYPFIELALGTAYLLGFRPMLVNAITLFVMVFSSIGVILAVMNKQKIRCACLGAVFNLPMSTVTVIEDLLMAAMAAWMLI
jgi:copper chaperone CopZ